MKIRIFLLFYFFATPAATIAQPAGHPTELALIDVTVLNGSGGGRFNEGARISITATPPSDDMHFVRWYSSYADWRFQDYSSSNTTFTTPKKPTEPVLIVAAYARIDAHFPIILDDDSLDTWLLLQRPSDGTSYTRFPHKVEIKIDVGDPSEFSRSEVFDSLHVTLGWFPLEEAQGNWHSDELLRYWTEDSGATEIFKDKFLDRSLFSATSDGYETTVWFAGDWVPRAPSDTEDQVLDPEAVTGFKLSARYNSYYHRLNSTRGELLKVEIGSQTEESFKNKHVYRGDPLRNWNSHSVDLNIPNTNFSGPIASHSTLGDYVHYKAYHPGLDSSLITNYKWTAEPADGYTNLTTIEGPDDASATEWKIEDGGVDWKSGIYDITLELTFSGGVTAKVTKEQTVWQRTDDVLVVAYIDENIPPVPGGGSAHAILSDGNVGQNMDYLLSPGSRAVFFGQIWLTNVYRTPFEPDVARRHLNRFVMVETANQQPPEHFQVDLSPTVSVYDEVGINSFFSNNINYRAINRLQAEYLLNESGEIAQGPEFITKLAYRTNNGDTPALEYAAPQSSTEDHPHSGVINTDGSTYDFHDVTHSIGVPQGFAQYVSGRVGSGGLILPGGQEMNALINDRDTPWIHGLIEFKGNAYGPENSDIIRQIFPTYWIYVNGDRVSNFPQSDLELFIQMGNTL